MKRIFLACICYLLILPTGLWAKRIIKVACVGNSITYGAGISNREKNSYPAQLQYYLGIIRKSKFPQNPKRSVRFSGKGTKRSVQKRKARNTQKAETKVL